jgi:hypothetical protein
MAVSSLKVEPAEVEPGEPVKVSFVIRETGSADAVNVPIVISIDGVEDHRVFVTRAEVPRQSCPRR